MKKLLMISVLFTFSTLISCGNSGGGIDAEEASETSTEAVDAVEITQASTHVDLQNKGIGPIKNLELSSSIDQAMADAGKEIYDRNCLACHKPTERFIGPPPQGILERRSPEWVMNMILNPEGMVKEDPLARALLIEFNGSPMANQNLTEEEARQVLEYFRTL